MFFKCFLLLLLGAAPAGVSRGVLTISKLSVSLNECGFCSFILCHYYIFARTPCFIVLLSRNIWEAVREFFLIFCHYYIFAKTPFVTVLLSRNIWEAVRGMFSYSLPLLYFRKNSLFYCTFAPMQKYQKISAQKERWLGQTGVYY